MNILGNTKRSLLRFGYQTFFKPVVFQMDAEQVHDQILKFGQQLGTNAATRTLTAVAFNYKNPILNQVLVGLKFENPIGLAGGFDKDLQLLEILPQVGFGFIEGGSVTGYPNPGNPKPRLWRLPKQRALVVNYGLKSKGSEIIAANLSKRQDKKHVIPLGINIAMTNDPTKNRDIETAISDYKMSYERLEKFADYVTINISCPNTGLGQPFLETENLEKLLLAINPNSSSKPLFLKISPDITDQHLYDIIRLAEKYNITGLVCTNLTKKKDQLKNIAIPGNGGISGKIVEKYSDDLIRKAYQYSHGKLIIIGCGGVFSAEDAYRKIKLGASLIQLATGMIYGGPQTIGEINAGLVELLKRDKFSSISEAIGKENNIIK